MYVCMHACMYVCMYMCVCKHIKYILYVLYIYIYISLSSYIHIYIYIYLFMCMYIHPVILLLMFFAGSMHSATKFAMTVLSRCVNHVCSARCREPLGECLSRWDVGSFDLVSEFAVFSFNLVIRFSKVEQLANFRFSACRMSTFCTTARCVGDSQFSALAL